jgi:hypothetical protein
MNRKDGRIMNSRLFVALVLAMLAGGCATTPRPDVRANGQAVEAGVTFDLLGSRSYVRADWVSRQPLAWRWAAVGAHA